MENVVTLKQKQKPFDPCESVCEECGRNRWSMWVYNNPKRLVFECVTFSNGAKCGAVVEMEIE